MSRDVCRLKVLQRGFKGLLHFDWRAHANRVGHVQALHADALHEAGQMAHALGRDLAFVRATHRAAHGAAHSNARRARRRHHGRKALNTVGDRAVDVALAEGFTGRSKDHDLVGPEFARCRQRGSQPLHVGRQHRIAHASLPRDAGHDHGGVRHLRHPLGADEAGDLDLFQSGGLQPLYQLDLDGGRHRGFFILQAVARTDIDQLNAGSKFHALSIPDAD